MTETIKLSEAMRNRVSMYNLLARVYRTEVDQQLLDELHAMHYPQNTGSTDADEAYRRLFTFMRDARENTLNDLAVDYARVFIGSGSLDARAAYPFESVYTSPRGLTMQDARDEVLAIYRSEGLGKDISWREAEDHLAVELEFMKVLCLRTEECLKQGNEETALSCLITQRDFLQDHIMTWAPVMFADVPRYAKHDFYPAFAHLSQAFLNEEEVLLEELTSETLIEEGIAQ